MCCWVPDYWLNGAEKVIETGEMASGCAHPICLKPQLSSCQWLALPYMNSCLISQVWREVRDSGPTSHLGQVPSTEWARVYYKFLCIARKHLVCSGLDSGLGTWREWNLACVWVSQLAEEKLMGGGNQAQSHGVALLLPKTLPRWLRAGCCLKESKWGNRGSLDCKWSKWFSLRKPGGSLSQKSLHTKCQD